VRAIVTGVALLSLVACQPPRASTSAAYPPAENEATVFLFLEPAAFGPEGLDLRLLEVSAIRSPCSNPANPCPSVRR